MISKSPRYVKVKKILKWRAIYVMCHLAKVFKRKVQSQLINYLGLIAPNDISKAVTSLCKIVDNIWMVRFSMCSVLLGH